MAVWCKFSPVKLNVRGYLTGRKKWWKRAIGKARRRFLKKEMDREGRTNA